MGGQKFIALFYQYLSELLPVTIISTKNNKPSGLKSDFLPLLGNSKLRYINPFLFFKIRRKLKENKTTHFILVQPYFGWLGILVKYFCKIRLAIHSHNIEGLRFKSIGKWWWGILWHYEKYTHRHADINFFITEEDRQYAIINFKLSPAICHILTYGFELKAPLGPEEKMDAKRILQKKYSISADEKILLFNGTLDYKPNLDAVEYILKYINPFLLDAKSFKYKIIICGKNLPESYIELKNYGDKNIIYAGFVDDIVLYFKGSDIFINPVIDGGGIKTKLVEALGYNVSTVSTVSGAFGVSSKIACNKMMLVEDNDWENFSKAILNINTGENISPAFFDYFYWGNIAKAISDVLSDDLKPPLIPPKGGKNPE